MYTRIAQHVLIKFKGDGGRHQFLRAKLRMHNTWLEVEGWQVRRDYKIADYRWQRNERGEVTKEMKNYIYPEGSILLIEVDNKKVDLRKYKKV